MKKIIFFSLFTFYILFLLNDCYAHFTFEIRNIHMTGLSHVKPIDNEIQLISVDEKTVFVLISTNGIVDQSDFSNSEEVNAYFMKKNGVVTCSYSWNHNNMKLVLDKTSAKQTLIDSFGFEPTIISNLF